MVQEFHYQAPATLNELLETLNEKGQDAKLLAGGTDLLPNIRSGVVKPKLVVDLKRIPGAGDLVPKADKGLSVGPAVTINQVLADEAVQKHYSLLAVCARDLASHQVRNRATVAGNVVNASPCSDMAPALLCLDARAVLADRRGSREVPFREFFTGVKKTVLKPNELLLRIEIPPAFRDGRGFYLKLKRIAGHDLGIVGVAMLAIDGRLRFAVSSAAPTPVFAGEFPASAKPEDIVSAVLGSVSPIDDVRSTKEYRLFMLGEYIRRLLKEVVK